jgi:alkylhydroperoxidase family enzyme
VQAGSMLPLLAAASPGATHGVTLAAIVAEHLASGLGTTVLFAALMSATHRERAALHYTVLTSLNAAAIALGGYAGSVTADVAGMPAAVGLAMALCLAPCALLSGWSRHAARSAGLDEMEVEDSLTVRGGSL